MSVVTLENKVYYYYIKNNERKIMKMNNLLFMLDKGSVWNLVRNLYPCACCDREGFNMKYGCHTMHFCYAEAVVKSLV